MRAPGHVPCLPCPNSTAEPSSNFVILVKSDRWRHHTEVTAYERYTVVRLCVRVRTSGDASLCACDHASVRVRQL